MDYLKIYKNQGFDDSLSHRNSKILEQASGTLKERKTGTTIVGCVFPGGIVLGADTRATSGSTVFDKNCAKLHKLAPNIYCAGAGTAADTEHVTLGVAA